MRWEMLPIERGNLLSPRSTSCLPLFFRIFNFMNREICKCMNSEDMEFPAFLVSRIKVKRSGNLEGAHELSHTLTFVTPLLSHLQNKSESVCNTITRTIKQLWNAIQTGFCFHSTSLHAFPTAYTHSMTHIRTIIHPHSHSQPTIQNALK